MRKRRTLSRSSWRIARNRCRMTHTDQSTREKPGTMTCMRRRMSSSGRPQAQRSDSKRRSPLKSVTTIISCPRTEGRRATSESAGSNRIKIFPRGPGRGRLLCPRPLKICFIAATARITTKTRGRCRARKSKAQRSWAVAPRSEWTSASLVGTRRRRCRTTGRASRNLAASTTWRIAKRAEKRKG